MISPYQPPKANLEPVVFGRRYKHAATSFASGLTVVPLLIFPGVRVLIGNMLGYYSSGMGNINFWACLVAGSFLAAIFVLPFQRCPLWLAALVGPSVVMIVLIVKPILERLGAA